MPVAVTMPDLGDSVADATISRWLRFPGDQIEEGEPIVEVSTDKVDTEISAPASGRLTEILAHEGDVSPIGADLALIDETVPSDEPAAPSPPATANDTTPPPMPSHTPDTPDTADKPDTNESVSTVSLPNTDTNPDQTPYVTPLVRRLATELGVDLTALQGSGVGNRIRKSDVLAAAAAIGTPPAAQPVHAANGPQTAPNPYLSPLVSVLVRQRGIDITDLHGTGRNNRIRLADVLRNHRRPQAPATRPDRVEKLTRLRKVIATRMIESLHTAAQLTTVVEVDMTAVNNLRQQYGPAFFDTHDVKLTFTSFFLRAAIDALHEFPALNASLSTADDTVTYHGAINVNVAVDTDRGLLAPTIRNADTLSIIELTSKTADLADRARSNTLTADELAGGTFTVTNTGSRGALFDTPIINQPQVAILGTGSVVARATVNRDDNGQETIEIRNMAYLALTYDHRLIDGADAARYLTTVKSKLEAADYAGELKPTP